MNYEISEMCQYLHRSLSATWHRIRATMCGKQGNSWLMISVRCWVVTECSSCMESSEECLSDALSTLIVNQSTTSEVDWISVTSDIPDWHLWFKFFVYSEKSTGLWTMQSASHTGLTLSSVMSRFSEGKLPCCTAADKFDTMCFERVK